MSKETKKTTTVVTDKEIQKQPEQKQELAKTDDGKSVQIIDTSTGYLPNLDEMVAMPAELIGVYWKPEVEKEKKKMIYQGTETIQVPSMKEENKGQLVDLECASFMWQNGEGNWQKVLNGGSRLVSGVKALKYGVAIEVTYLGKKKNSSNNYDSGVWSIKYLLA